MSGNNVRLKNLRVLRGILKELSLGKQIGSPAHKYLMDQYKANQTTSSQYCRDPEAASYNASTLHCMLRSSREHAELVKKYGGGENSIRKAAERVGLKLPEEYKSSSSKNDEKEE